MKNAFGLDIGVTSIRAVWLTKAKNGFQLTSYIAASVPAKGMLSESPLDEEEMANAIRQAVETAKIKTKNVNIALAESQVYTKVIEMPALSDKELSLAINWEAEQYIPVPLSSVYLVWTVLNPPQKNQKKVNNKIQVLVVGAPIVTINKYQKILEMSGLNVVAIETEILSVVRVLTYQKEGTKTNFPPTIILSIGAVSTALALVIDRIITFTYSIPVGGIAMDRAIEADLGISLMQAEEYKKVYGIYRGGASDKIGKAVEPILNSILSEVKKIMIFYSQRYKDVPIQQILLSGGTARLPGIDLFFAQHCGIETVTASPWNILAQGQQLSQDVLNQASNYAIAIGLAVRGYD